MQLAKRYTSTLKSLIVLFAVTLSLAGCLLVEDFGKFWDQGHADIDLVGQWHHTQASDNVIFVKKGNTLVYMDKKSGKTADTTELRTTIYGENKFLLARNNKAKGLFHYTIKGDIFTLYAFKKESRGEFSKFAQESENLILEDQGVRVLLLDDNTMVSLNQSIKDGLWAPVATMSRGISESSPQERMTIEQIKSFEANKINAL
jgi:hypothetical protein